jgi:hypothetical protein
MALNEFVAWFQQEPRYGFTKATVSAWRVSLEDRRLGSSSIIVPMSAIRKLAAESADNGLLAPELAVKAFMATPLMALFHPKAKSIIRVGRICAWVAF